MDLIALLSSLLQLAVRTAPEGLVCGSEILATISPSAAIFSLLLMLNVKRSPRSVQLMETNVSLLLAAQ